MAKDALSRHVGKDDAHQTPKRAGAPVDPWWVLGLLRRGWKTLSLALVVGLVVGGLLAQAIPLEWQSEAVLVADVESDGANPFVQQDTLHEGVELLRHPSTLSDLRDRLEIPGSLAALQKRIDVESETQSNLILVRARSASASGAAALAENMAEVFLDRRRASERVRLRARAEARRSELAAAEEQLAQARAEYDRFRVEHQIADLTVEQQSAIAEAARLSAEADTEQVAALTAEVRMRALREEARRLPRMQTASANTTDPVRAELAAARAELATARARYTPDHPAVQALESRVTGLERTQRAGGNTVVMDATSAVNPVREELEGNAAMATADRATALRRTAALRELAEQARERVRALSELEGRASLLLAAVNVGSRQVDELRTAIGQDEDRAGNPPPGFHIAAHAAQPESALPSKGRKFAWLVPPLVALLAAFGWLFFRERGTRTRSPVEVAWWADAPVIGTTTWPRDPMALDLLVSELEDLGTYAAGRTLVVPATDDERELATEFAARLAEAPWLAAGVMDVDVDVPNLPAGEGSGARRRPTLPIAVPTSGVASPIVPPAPREDGVQRATVRLMVADVDASDSPSASDEAAPSTSVGTEDGPVVELTQRRDSRRRRRASNRMKAGAPQVLVGSDVRASATVEVGGQERAVKAIDVDEVQDALETGNTDGPRDGTANRGSRKQDAVLTLAMRILGDGSERGSADHERATVFDVVTPAHRPSDPSESRAPHEQAVALAWNGPLQGPTLRRAARLADRVIVVVRDGALGPAELTGLHTRLGREDALGLLVVGVDDESANRQDRIGPVTQFWLTRKRLPG